MSELDTSNVPVQRNTKELLSRNFLNFDNNRPQKFVVITILAYFGTKIFNNFFSVYSTKNNTQETLDLLATITLSAVLFYLTGLNTRPTLGTGNLINLPFFLGLLLGTTSSLFEDKTLTSLSKSSPMGYTSLKIFFLTICVALIAFNIFLSTTISAQHYPSTSNYLIYIFIIATVLAALYYSKMTNVVCDGPDCPPDIPINPSPHNNPSCTSKPSTDKDGNPTSSTSPTVLSLKTTKFNLSFGVMSFLMALTFLYDSSNPIYNSITSFFFGLFTGTYISNFSTYGVKYTVQSNTTINETSPISPDKITSALDNFGIKSTDKYDIFNKIDGKKYKPELDKACKIVINDNLTINSKNAKSILFYKCVQDKVYIEGKYTLKFYVDQLSYTKVALFIILSIASLAILVYVTKRIAPTLSL
jgi:hypothetical protein